MDFITNARGTNDITALHQTAVVRATKIEAAIAYVLTEKPFIELCWQNQKPLTLYARYDHTGPVSDPVLQWFLQKGKQTANYQLRLVPDIFHPKIIRWHGVGAYIGSANLSVRAWSGNFEAGIFLTETELQENEVVDDLERFFADVHAASRPLTREIADEMTRMSTRIHGPTDSRIEQEFEKSRIIPRLPSLISVTRIPRSEKSKNEFLREWDQTLQDLRNIGARIAEPQNLPKWIPVGSPNGVLADQFLHAYYYNRVRDGNRYPYPELHHKNRDNRERALAEEIAWWRNLKSAPSSEDIHILDWAPKVRGLLASGEIARISRSDFSDLCVRVHAIREHAARISHKAFGLSRAMDRMDREERTRFFANWLYDQRAPDGSSPGELFDYVLYGGPEDEAPKRLYAACFDPNMKIPHVGVSTLGEIVGWALPDKYPPRNGRTSKALFALGFDVTIHSE